MSPQISARQNGVAGALPTSDASDGPLSTDLANAAFNVCQEALCDDGRKAAFFIPFILTFVVVVGFLVTLFFRRRARDFEKVTCDDRYIDAVERGQSFDYASLASHHPRSIVPQYPEIQSEYARDCFSLEPGITKAAFSRSSSGRPSPLTAPAKSATSFGPCSDPGFEDVEYLELEGVKAGPSRS